MLGDQLLEAVTTRHNEGIDPSMHVWGWEIPVYLFLGGLAAGLMILGATLELVRGARSESTSVRLMPFAALGLLTLGMVALFLDLEYKAHVYRFYTTFQIRSPMSWGSWILLLVYPAALLAGLGGLAPAWRRRLAPACGIVGRWMRAILVFARARRRTVLWTCVAVGAALGIYTGLLLGTLNARPLWNSIIMGPLFLCSGISTGAAFMLLFSVRHAEHRLLVRWDLIAIGAELACIALLLLDLAAGTRASRLAAHELLGGPWTGLFWALVVGAGLLVPLGMEWIEIRRRRRPTLLAPILILIGGFWLRYILVAAGQAASFGSF